MKFKVSDKLVKARDGAFYDIKNYVEGVDYVPRRAFKGVKLVFRANILEQAADHIVLSVVDPSLVKHKQDMEPLIIRPALLDGSVRAAKVVKKHANQRFVETDTLGRVFVGEKGHQIKMSQIINVKDGMLYLGRAAAVLIH